MKRKSVYTCLVMLFMSLVLQAKDKDVAVAEALLKRLLPSYIESFQFQKLKGEQQTSEAAAGESSPAFFLTTGWNWKRYTASPTGRSN